MNLTWFNNQVTETDKVKIPANCLGFLLGASVFEAVRVYWNAERKEYCLFNVHKHINRLFDSLKIMRMTVTFDKKYVENAVLELLDVWDEKKDGYIRITAFVDSPSPGSSVYDPCCVHTNLMISLVDSPIPDKNIDIKCCISSWRRISDNSMPPRVKSACNYENTRLAGFEAKLNGFDNAIFINEVGKVSEAAESSVFIIDSNKKLITPPVYSDILCSINRELIIRIAKECLGLECIERIIDRTELYLAAEVFICNTAKLIRSVNEIDHIIIGGRKHVITDAIMKKYLSIVRGDDRRFLDYSMMIRKE